ncbi:MICOS complex subunit Mic60-like [Cylas formicarius]|uniref:MICOS complex subunit Mic60-like n=1 Tax=Cylas formicarius TaxID=197179 RepID=UPI002958C551|nr:MICOS complex subunit Mic60-like [Cylas formicarius]
MLTLKIAQKILRRWLAHAYTTKGISSGLVGVRHNSRGKICPPDRDKPKTSGDGGGGRKLMMALGATTLAAGATLAYAKYDPNFRSKFEDHFPIAKPLFKTLDGANLSIIYANAKQTLIGIISDGGKEAQLLQTGDDFPASKEYKAPTPIVPALADELAKLPERYHEIRVEQREEDKDEPKVEIKGEPKPKPRENDARYLAELEEQIGSFAAEAVNAYADSIRILYSYNQDVEHIIDTSINDVQTDVWENIRNKTKAKNECIKRAQEKAQEATDNINRLKNLITQTEFVGSENTKFIIENKISKIQSDLETARLEMEFELKHGGVTEKYWDKVEKARKRFSEELEILFPNVDLAQKILKLNHEELDLFILHVYANVLFYQKELAKMETILQNKIDNAIEAARKGDYEPLSIAQICAAIEQDRRKLTECFQQQLLRLKKQNDEELKIQLQKQSQVFNEQLGDAVRIKELEISRMLSTKFDELLERERCKYKTELAAIAGKLRGLDEAIKARNEAQASSKQSQVLWSACQSLLRAMRVGCPGIPWKDQIRPLEPEINAVLKAAAPNDEVVCIVIQEIPHEARQRGVYPEDALRDRFFKVARVAQTVALVPAEGAALPIHMLSYLESCLLVGSANSISRAELNDELVDFSKMNTHEILQRARRA